MQFAHMTETTTVTQELRLLRESAGLSLQDVASRLGWNKSSYNHYENPKRFKREHLPVHVAKKLIAALADTDIEPDQIWRLTGSQPSIDGLQTRPDDPNTNNTAVNVLNVEASAGGGSFVTSEEVIDQLSFPPDYLRRLTRTAPRHLAIIGVKGDSMEPTLKDDDIVMVDTAKTSLDFDGLFVLRWGDALHVKRIARAPGLTVRIISDNHAIYPPMDLPRAEVEVLGKVIWMGKKV